MRGGGRVAGPVAQSVRARTQGPPHTSTQTPPHTPQKWVCGCGVGVGWVVGGWVAGWWGSCGLKGRGSGRGSMRGPAMACAPGALCSCPQPSVRWSRPPTPACVRSDARAYLTCYSCALYPVPTCTWYRTLVQRTLVPKEDPPPPPKSTKNDCAKEDPVQISLPTYQIRTPRPSSACAAVCRRLADTIEALFPAEAADTYRTLVQRLLYYRRILVPKKKPSY